MSDPTASESPLFEKNRRTFLLRKLHSLSGIVPVGGFMLFHLWTNAKATQGREQFDRAVEDIGHMPFVAVLEWALILLPLAFHALYGVRIAMQARQNVGRYTYGRNWMFFFQRLTGLLAFAFIGLHLYEYWGHKTFGSMEPAQFYGKLCENLSSTRYGVPWLAIAYVVGIGASVFHFANGLWGFCFSWGITVSRRSQRMAASVFGVVGLAVFFLGLNTVVHFATGESLTAMGHRLISGRADPTPDACEEFRKKDGATSTLPGSTVDDGAPGRLAASSSQDPTLSAR